MSNELALNTASGFELMLKQSDVLAQSRIIPAAYRNRSSDIVAAGLAGLSFGWDVMTSLRNYHVIEGTASLRPEAMLGLVRRAGHSVTLQLCDGEEGRQAIAMGRRADSGDEHRAIFSERDAANAGLATKKNWKQYLDSMLTWRAVSQLCRVLFPDVVLGAGYVPEELGGDVDSSGTPIEADPFSDPVIPIAEAKRRLLFACDNDKDIARTIWESQEDLPHPNGIKESVLQLLLDQVLETWDNDIQDADIVQPVEQTLELSTEDIGVI